MARVQVSELKSGMKLAEHVVGETGAILVPEGTVLTQKTVDYLKYWRVKSVMIEDEPESIQTAREAHQEKFKEEYLATTEQVMEFMEGIRGSRKVNMDEVREIVTEIDAFARDVHSVKLVTEVKNKDYYTYQHSMNVGIYSSLLGRWLGYPSDVTYDLSIAGFLHDIGKTQVDNEILLKPGPLTPQEYDEMKKHASQGYDILKASEDLSIDIKLAVLQHHERENGTGYPLGFTGNKIHPYAKIISVVDIFDAITSNRAYKSRESPFKAVKELRDKSFKDLNAEVAFTFFKKITELFIGSTVVFDDGSMGEIVFLNQQDPTRPLVKLEDEFIDLTKNQEREIVDVLVF